MSGAWFKKMPGTFLNHAMSGGGLRLKEPNDELFDKSSTVLRPERGAEDRP